MAHVTSKLGGRLGNQLFQYAVAVVQASLRRATYDFDVSGLTDRDLVALRQWVGMLPVASPDAIRTLKGDDGLGGKLYRAFQRLLPRAQRTWRLQTNSVFDLTPPRRTKSLYLDGYWQGWSALAEHRPAIKQAVSFRGQLGESATSLLMDVSCPATISVHVRRGDYFNDSSLAVPSVDYFVRAVDEIRRSSDAQRIFVFSDDVDWCRATLSFPLPTEFVVGNPAEVDLFLMTQCEHHVIVNSTFSWWGAWLGKEPQGRVIAPRMWFPSFGSTPPLSFIYPPQWTIIEP